jgi:thioredoxin reductase (NADPH)
MATGAAAPRNAHVHDVVIVGGGPAGVSCALECHDMRLDYLLLEARAILGGQLSETPNSVRNLAAGRFPSGEALRLGLEDAASLLGDRRLLGFEVERVDFGAGWVEGARGRVHARAFVVATGCRRRQLPFAPPGAFGGDVAYEIEPDPRRFAGCSVVVVGGGDSAALDALELASLGCSVHIVHRSAFMARPDIVAALRSESRVVDVPGSVVQNLAGDARLGAVVVSGPQGTRRIDAQRLVVKIGYAPAVGPFRGQVELDPSGAIVVGRDLETSRAGVYAAGDVVAGAYPRVASAMGDGVRAASAVLRRLSGS